MQGIFSAMLSMVIGIAFALSTFGGEPKKNTDTTGPPAGTVGAFPGGAISGETMSGEKSSAAGTAASAPATERIEEIKSETTTEIKDGKKKKTSKKTTKIEEKETIK
jgi:hypothetical protein